MWVVGTMEMLFYLEGSIPFTTWPHKVTLIITWINSYPQHFGICAKSIWIYTNGPLGGGCATGTIWGSFARLSGLQWRPVRRFLTLTCFSFSCSVHWSWAMVSVDFVSKLYCICVRPRHVCLAPAMVVKLSEWVCLVVSGSALRLFIFGTRIHWMSHSGTRR